MFVYVCVYDGYMNNILCIHVCMLTPTNVVVYMCCIYIVPYNYSS